MCTSFGVRPPFIIPGALLILPHVCFLLILCGVAFKLDKGDKSIAYKKRYIAPIILSAFIPLYAASTLTFDDTVTGTPAFPLGEKINLQQPAPLTLTKEDNFTYTAKDSSNPALTITITTGPDGRIISTEHVISFRKPYLWEERLEYAFQETHKHYGTNSGFGRFKHELYDGQRSLDITKSESLNQIKISFTDHAPQFTPGPLTPGGTEDIDRRLNGIFN